MTNLNTPHAFTRDNAAQAFMLTIAGQPTRRLAMNMTTPQAALALAELVKAANVDKAALRDVADYCERLDVMVDAYHFAPIWRRLWWAITNDLPYQPKKEDNR